MIDHIELHDSRVAAAFNGNALVLQLRPAYVHHWTQSAEGWQGEGRSQSVDIVIGDGAVKVFPGDGSFEIADGWFDVGSRLYENMIPVLLDETANVRGHLALVNGESIDLTGHSIAVCLMEWEFVEYLPSKWAPD